MHKCTFWDLVIITIVSFLIVFLFVKQCNQPSQQKTLCVITKKDKQYYTLQQKLTIEVQGTIGITIIEIDYGKFRFVESACQQKICVNQGFVSLSGLPIVCLPNEVSAYIISDKEEKNKNNDQQIIDGVTF